MSSASFRSSASRRWGSGSNDGDAVAPGRFSHAYGSMAHYPSDDSVSSPSANEQSYGSCNLLADQWESRRPVAAMLRVRLKADGRIVEILPDGSEAALPSPLAEIAQQMRQGRPAGGWVAAAPGAPEAPAHTAYSTRVPALTQA